MRIKFTLNEKSFPEGAEILKQLDEVWKKEGELLQEATRILDKSALGTMIGAMKTYTYTPKVEKVSGVAAVVMHKCDVSEAYLPDAKQSISLQNLDSRTANLLLNAPLLTREEKRKMLGLEPLPNSEPKE